MVLDNPIEWSDSTISEKERVAVQVMVEQLTIGHHPSPAIGREPVSFKSCMACGNGVWTHRTLDEETNLQVRICSQCGYAARQEKAEKSFNIQTQLETASTHAAVPSVQSTQWPHRPALIASQLNRLCPKKGNVLDIGCSNGMNLIALGPGWNKFGVELSPATAKAASSYASADVFNGRIEDYSPPVSEFDLITAYALIEHLQRPDRLFEWAYKHLQKGGIFAVMTGDRESKTAQMMGDRWPLYHCTDHFHYFSADSVRRIAVKNGFRVLREEWRYMYSWKSRLLPGEHQFQKLKEIFGIVRRPVFDHYYCYLIKE